MADVALLPSAQREALILSELGDFAHNEVAQVIGCERSKVKSLVFQARSALIERRAARELRCRSVQEEVANLGRSRMPRHVRRHVEGCPNCTAFASAVRKQRRLIALALPITPSIGLKRTIFASVGGGGAGGGGAGGAAAGGGLAAGTVGGIVAGGGGGGLLAATLITKLGLGKAAAIGLAAASVSAGAGATAENGADAIDRDGRTRAAERDRDGGRRVRRSRGPRAGRALRRRCPARRGRPGVGSAGRRRRSTRASPPTRSWSWRAAMPCARRTSSRAPTARCPRLRPMARPAGGEEPDDGQGSRAAARRWRDAHYPTSRRRADRAGGQPDGSTGRNAAARRPRGRPARAEPLRRRSD